MKKHALILALLLSMTATVPAVAQLNFNKGKQFKLVQFTDVHYRCTERANSLPALQNIRYILDTEKPDAVVITGDLAFSEPAFECLDSVLKPLIDRHIPYMVVEGNHDSENGRTRQEIYDYVSKKPYCLNPKRTGEGMDYTVTIKSSKDKKADAMTLYLIDSNDYPKIKGMGGYDWIHHGQIDWYRKRSEAIKAAAGGDTVPAMAFFHIPLPEYPIAYKSDKCRVIGIRGEQECAPEINSGFFAAAKEQGDIMAIFVGHDHNNDYATMYQGILLAYGRYSGGNTVYNDYPRGARIILLDEGKRTFTSYIRQYNGERECLITYPDSYLDR